MTLLSILIVGFLLGMKHATEADHLAAVATLATRQTTLLHTVRQGVAWGIGHTLILLLLGGVVLLLGAAVPERLSQALEFGVGLMLVALGIDVLRRVRRLRIHVHAHSHGGGVVHLHAHSHADESVHSLAMHRHQHAPRLPPRALLIGMIHGMAGSAAMVLLSLARAPSLGAGLLYIAVFGCGSILGMALLSTAIAVPLRWSARWLTWLHTGMNAVVGAFSCGLGLFMIYRIGVVDGLLGATLRGEMFT
jgi:High-affinity nickel-transport protein